jgi:hypothetical protein
MARQKALTNIRCLCLIRGTLKSLVIALRPQTPKHIRGGWSHYTDTSKPVAGNGAHNNYGHCPIPVSNQRPFDHWQRDIREPVAQWYNERPSPMQKGCGSNPVRNKDFRVCMTLCRTLTSFGWAINRGPVCVRLQSIKHAL